MSCHCVLSIKCLEVFVIVGMLVLHNIVIAHLHCYCLGQQYTRVYVYHFTVFASLNITSSNGHTDALKCISEIISILMII